LQSSPAWSVKSEHKEENRQGIVDFAEKNCPLASKVVFWTSNLHGSWPFIWICYR
jgi:hypothetical protein